MMNAGRPNAAALSVNELADRRSAKDSGFAECKVDDLGALSGMKLHGLEVSYFTGKLEAYLRYCGLPYEFRSLNSRGLQRVADRTGLALMPALELVDGRWMTDSSAIIEWIEARRVTAPVIPRDPEQAFFSRLLEDFADEWLWRPALHYRWSYRRDARELGSRIAREILPDVPAPLWLKRVIVIYRQRAKYIAGDGVTPSTRTHVEQVYLEMLGWMEAALADRNFLLGARPTLADFGFMGPMFRHFSQDPTPAAIMRRDAPRTLAWVSRMWEARAQHLGDGALDSGVPPAWDTLLGSLLPPYLSYLTANVEAYRAGEPEFAWEFGNVVYRLPVNHYRIYALQRLHSHYAMLPEAAARAVRNRLIKAGCWGTLWQVPYPASRFDPGRRLPFLDPTSAWSEAPLRHRRWAAHDGCGR